MVYRSSTMNNIPVKTPHYPVDLVPLAMQLKALAHPARLAILQTLSDRGTCVCGEVVDILPLAQATVSQHLRALRNAGLIRGEVDGPRTCYCLDPSAINELVDVLEKYLRGIATDSNAGGNLDCC